MRRAVILLIILEIAAVAGGGGPTTVEEIVAVVGETPILASDVELAELVQLVPPEPQESEETYRGRLLEARIRLELELRDLEESGVLFRLELDLEAATRELVGRSNGEAWLRSHLAPLGLRWSDLEELALRVAAARAYTEQRLRPRISIGSEELDAVYRALRDEMAGTGEEAPPMAAVRDRLRRLVVERKLNAEIERWLAQAREHLPVTRFR